MIAEASAIPKRLVTSFNRIKKRGGVVLVHHGVERGGATSYQLQDGGSVAPGTVFKLKDCGLLISGRDGLLSGCEQTLHCSEASP